MSTTTVKTENAIKAYAKADANGKSLLKILFPDIEFEKPENIMDRVKTWGDACKIISIDPVKSLPFDPNADGFDQEQAAVNAFFMLSKIRQVLNEGWLPDWANSNQAKYVPWFDNYSSGSGFSCSAYGAWNSAASCGSRLCYKTSELAVYAGKQFIDIYNQFLTIK